MRADAIVNAANRELWMGAGVAGALKRRGGIIIEKEAVSKGPIEIGTAIATTAGSLDARWVIHAAAMGPDLLTDEGKVRNATASALKLARDLGAESIAMPSLGTGVGGFPIREAADVMMGETVEHARESSVPARIIFVLFSEVAKMAYDRAMEQVVQ